MAEFKIKSMSLVNPPLRVGGPNKYIIKGNGFKPGIAAAQWQGRNITPAVTSCRFIDSSTLEIEIYFDKIDANREHPINIVNGDGHQAIVKIRVGAVEDAKIGPQFYGDGPILELPPDIDGSYINLEVVTGLLREGTNVNAKDEGGMTLLHFAILLEETDVAEMLIARSADVNAKNNDGETPLHYIALSGDDFVDTAELLIAGGADVNVKDNNGETPLYQADTRGFKAIAELLKKHGAKE